MSFPVVLVQDPNGTNYDNFFRAVFKSLPASTGGIDIVVVPAVSSTGELNQILLVLYTQVRQIASSSFTYEFEIDVLVNLKVDLKGRKVFSLECEKSSRSPTSDTIAVTVAKRQPESVPEGVNYKGVQTTAVGGTFDHMHDGHKILLSMTAFAASKNVIVGVTGPKLLVKKKYAEVMEPLQVRVMRVCGFLQKIAAPGLRFLIYQINDVCGPTGFVKAIDALIISQETVEGGDFVNKFRLECGFPKLEIVVARVIGGDDTSNASNKWKGKLSSTDIREAEYHKIHPTGA